MKLLQSASNYRNLRGLVFFVSLCILITTTTNQANANMFNRFKKGFYFEKYGDSEDARVSGDGGGVRKALLKLHPIGSDVRELVKTLEKAGAKCYDTNYILDNTGSRVNAKGCQYVEWGILFDTHWRAGADYDDNFLITKIYSGSGIK
ncbi:MAG: hypothetical protein V4612_05420 [Pseudomonadota bacterium]